MAGSITKHFLLKLGQHATANSAVRRMHSLPLSCCMIVELGQAMIFCAIMKTDGFIPPSIHSRSVFGRVQSLMIFKDYATEHPEINTRANLNMLMSSTEEILQYPKLLACPDVSGYGLLLVEVWQASIWLCRVELVASAIRLHCTELVTCKVSSYLVVHTSMFSMIVNLFTGTL